MGNNSIEEKREMRKRRNKKKKLEKREKLAKKKPKNKLRHKQPNVKLLNKRLWPTSIKHNGKNVLRRLVKLIR